MKKLLMPLLTLIGIGLVFVSWFLPWWSVDIIPGQTQIPPMYDAVQVRPWGLEQSLGQYASYIKGSDMPAFFAPLMWIYLGLVTAVLLFSMFAREKEISFGKFSIKLPTLLILGAGLSYIIAVVTAVVMIAIRAGDFWGTPVMGDVFVTSLETFATSKLLLGYWLACGAGLYITILAVLRSKIVGNK
jgi:hypothetical protein